MKKPNANSNEDSKFPDSSIFIVSFVPLILKSDDVMWSNDVPSSVDLCRIVKFLFTTDNTEQVLHDYIYYSNLLQKVETYTFELQGLSFEVSFELHCTMIDGKICNFLTGQKAENCCNICGVSPSNVNNLQYLKNLKGNEEYYKFGLSTLQCWIRFMEYLLHISYNRDFKKITSQNYWRKNTQEK